MRGLLLDAFDPHTGHGFRLEPEDVPSLEIPAPRLRCARCRHVLARRAQALEVHGRRRHVATNPAGITYTFRTYVDAPGCRLEAGARAEHSWFPPFAWTIADCGGCGVQCGWCFSARGAARFFALIEDRVQEDAEQ